jgi:hypothetical protein
MEKCLADILQKDGVSTLATTETHDPASGRFANIGAMGSARTDHAATLLPSPTNNY